MGATLGDKLRGLRAERGLTQRELAMLLGIEAFALRRMEAGTALPTPAVAQKLRDIGVNVSSSETNERSRSRAKALPEGQPPFQSTKLTMALRGATAPAWMANGPPDQHDFFAQLLDLQRDDRGWVVDAKRLSLVDSINGYRVAQAALEKPAAKAAAWNSNYGAHGWHRYIGRFPPHLVRALLNHFRVGAQDIVCDPFSGSGTTALECRLLGIPFVGIEICPLSHLIATVKAHFPAQNNALDELSMRYAEFMARERAAFVESNSHTFSVADVLAKAGNPIPAFANIEKWFTPAAFLGVSLTVEFALTQSGYERAALLVALSAKMRSIGNVDVDVVRAEYSRVPRENVDVEALVSRQLAKMSRDIRNMVATHGPMLGAAESVSLLEASVLQADLPNSSVDCIITSPPYGVEAISYLRTHLLSYRALVAELGHDPYDTRDQTIGSEYLEATSLPANLRVSAISRTFEEFFATAPAGDADNKRAEARRLGMMKFFEDMYEVGERMARWLKVGGKLAFVVGNKRLGDRVIPTDAIIREVFQSHGLRFVGEIRHKLKTNNSNSQVPWQERIIQEEAVLLFERGEQ